MPTVFISYAWDDDAHTKWVRKLATRLRQDGIDVSLDQWDAVPGDQLPQFMESSIRENDYVLIVCTPNYKQKSDLRKGGVGYEGDVITAELFAKGNQRKYIPILRGENWDASAPSWVAGKFYISMNQNPISESAYADLIATITNTRAKKPALGKPKPSSPNSIRVDTADHEFTPITITGIILDEVSEPTMDGTRGSALYAVPFQLTESPSYDWQNVFLHTWKRPPSFSLMHRPSIARVSGDKIILDGTTIDEVRDHHRNTLKLVVDRTNEVVAEHLRKEQQRKQMEHEKSQKHRDNIRDIGGSIKF